MKKIFLALLSIIILISSCKDEDEIDRNLDTYADWMTSLIVEHGDEITLKNISMPGAHDAGMYILTDCSIGANSCNTQTQDQDMTTMLEAGVRAFDVRPVLKNGRYVTQHVTECFGLGCDGDYLDNILDQTKSFLDNHSEMVVFLMTHFCSTDSEDQDLIQLIQNKLGDRLYRGEGTNEHFVHQPLSEILDLKKGHGKVLLIFEDASFDPALQAEGIFANSFLPLEGSYANSFNLETMKQDQLNKFQNHDPSQNNIFEMSWTMTLDQDLSILCAFDDGDSIESFAIPANQDLIPSMRNWIENNEINNNKIPNIIWVDYASTFVTDACLEICGVGLTN